MIIEDLLKTGSGGLSESDPFWIRLLFSSGRAVARSDQLDLGPPTAPRLPDVFEPLGHVMPCSPAVRWVSAWRGSWAGPVPCGSAEQLG